MGYHSLLRDLPDLGIEPRSPALQADSPPSELPESPNTEDSHPLLRRLSAKVMNLAIPPPRPQVPGLVALELRQKLQGSRPLSDPHCPSLPAVPSALQNHDMIKCQKGETCSVKPLLFSRSGKHTLTGIGVGTRAHSHHPGPLALTILRFQALTSLMLGKVLFS